jgi:hypothetical protein
MPALQPAIYQFHIQKSEKVMAFLAGMPSAAAAQNQPPRFVASDPGRSRKIQAGTVRSGHMAAKSYLYVASVWKESASA